MKPEDLTALASIGTFVVIAVTAIAAIVQLRHIRAGNQLAAILEYVRLWESDAIQSANRFIREKLSAKLKEADYRSELFERDVDRIGHPELVAADWCEQVGSYIKYGLIAPEQFIDIGGSYVSWVWGALREVVAIRRVAGGQTMYENFEYLAALTARWMEQHTGGNYPKTTPRLLSEQAGLELAGTRPAVP